MVVPEESECEISCAYELAILGNEPTVMHSLYSLQKAHLQYS